APARKEYEERVLTAAGRVEARERELFDGLRSAVGRQIRRLQAISQIIAELDVLAAFAEAAAKEGYVRPQLMDDFSFEITAGRHPVVERMMPREKFIPNDISLSEDARMIILTGPNMAGKSTVLRQVGLIVLMAQVGSFVPATKARIGIVDRLFTRVGASDNLVRGQSTFMVEMSETSAILHTATSRSLVLLDEIGRAGPRPRTAAAARSGTDRAALGTLCSATGKWRRPAGFVRGDAPSSGATIEKSGSKPNDPPAGARHTCATRRRSQAREGNSVRIQIARGSLVLLLAAVVGCKKGKGSGATFQTVGRQPDLAPVMLNKELPFRYPPALYAQ